MSGNPFERNLLQTKTSNSLAIAGQFVNHLPVHLVVADLAEAGHDLPCAALDVRVVNHVEIQVAREHKAERAAPRLGAAHVRLHHNGDQLGRALARVRIVELHGAVLVGPGCDLLAVAARDKDQHGLGVVDAICHLRLDMVLHALAVKPRDDPELLQSRVKGCHPRVVVPPFGIVAPAVGEEHLRRLGLNAGGRPWLLREHGRLCVFAGNRHLDHRHLVTSVEERDRLPAGERWWRRVLLQHVVGCDKNAPRQEAAEATNAPYVENASYERRAKEADRNRGAPCLPLAQGKAEETLCATAELFVDLPLHQRPLLLRNKVVYIHLQRLRRRKGLPDHSRGTLRNPSVDLQHL
eukprot:m.84466 g.84466  ORF g.84466 m.84466 type:complete len:351 (-) comp15022_c0_seq6:50-1102(-)